MTKPSLVAAAALVAAGAGVVAIPAMAATKTVKATSANTWSPKSLSVKKGDTVRFTWSTSAPHNVRKTSGAGKALRTGISQKGSGSFKVPAKGTYRFVCDVHPGTMKITVKAS
ncbi:hypothetical protein GKE82_21675 [Conexibacter sp. W3-3-2]|uniref:cupredoxin domain-containing protein n=1 Tax=Conexibacter sp. W3-3-2 TaxID=2675227 RepID=UPI0012B9A049|nr:plastocyanin/azurin family copper-binding protein [Conexibacter sp. W3-3-2]MTD46830.1 hypothetical protein [Conexibacter sp. W3-3-2]